MAAISMRWLRMCATMTALALALIAPVRAVGQEPAFPPCVAVADSVAAKGKAPATTPNVPAFYDEPQFTVAGVADASQTGGHGSDTVLRSAEALTKETVALHDPQPDAASEATLRVAVDREPANAALHHQLGDLEEKQGHPLQAVQEYQRAAELAPSEGNLFDWGAELLLHRAYEPGGEVFTKGRRLFPASVRMAVGQGIAAYARGAFDVAAQKLCEASDLDPADPRPYLFLGRVLTVQPARLPGEVERLARFARLQPDNAWASYYYALSLWQRREGPQGDSVRIEELLQKAVRIDPKLAPGFLQLGILYSDRKDWASAIRVLKSALDVDPELAEAHFRLATAYRLSGEPDKAKAELESYEHISKKNSSQAEKSRHEILQFVYSERPRDVGSVER